MTGKEILERAAGVPKYKRIYAELRETLDDGTYTQGNKMPSESDLVKTFSASRPTIRRALAQLELDGLITRRMGSGTVVTARNNRKHLVFGLLIPELGMTEIFEPICQGISQAQLGGQHQLLWGSTLMQGTPKDVQAEHLCRYYIEQKVSGVFFAPMELFAGGDAVNASITRAFDEARVPVVLLDRDITRFPLRSKYDVVGIDNHRAGYTITEHHLLSGSRRIAFLGRPFSAHTVEARVAGYQQALYSHLGTDAPILVKWAEPGNQAEIADFIKCERPDAFVCANDYTAAQLLNTLNGLGISVPDQISVSGIDDVRYARLLQTPLTTIHQPCLEIGSTALQAMLNRIATPTAPSRDYLVDFQLIVRQSTVAQRNAQHPIRETGTHTSNPHEAIANDRPVSKSDEAISVPMETLR